MDQNNPYQSPESDVVKSDAESLSTRQICALILIFLQTTLFALNWTTLLDTARVGAISPFTLLLSIAASFFLVMGGVMLFFRSRSAKYFLCLSLFVSVLVLIQSNTSLATTDLGISFISTLISFNAGNQKPIKA